MPRDMILHIGTNKTGSTSIQRVLSTRRRDIFNQGMFYPRTPGFERHANLATAATTNPKFTDIEHRTWKFASPDIRLNQFRSDFANEMNSLPRLVKRVIISAEQLSMNLVDRQSVQNLHDMLAPHVDAITVIVYLRRPDQHLTSLYSEMVRWGDARPPGLAKLKLPSAHAYDYAGLLELWASVFGETAVKPQIFERRPGQDFDIVQEFLTLVGLELKARPEAAPVTVNEALSFPAQKVLVELRRQITGGKRANVSSRRWRVLVAAAAAALPGRSWRPTQQEAADFVARYFDNFEEVRRRWFPERTTLFSTDFSDLPTEAMALDRPALLNACLKVVLEAGTMITKLEDKMAEDLVPVAELTGDDQKLHRSLAKRIHLFPDNVEARVRLARLLHKKEDVRAAERLIEAALKIDPDNPDALAFSRELAVQSPTATDRSAEDGAVSRVSPKMIADRAVM